ncbi:hypothetical protein C8F01DRAFT_1154442 [Mycena amicta]|nr:hypothetical protein C8F01DRAFT_1154442 [Mycena amicta]
MTSENISLCVRRPSAPGSTGEHAVLAFSSVPTQTLPQNHVLIRVERFGFSANNVTYEALGEQTHFRYFDFHAAPETGKVSSKTHGLVPVWGFGTVVASTHPKIPLGERVYGYLAPYRRPYNQIIRCSSDPEYTPTELGEDLTMLYRPLFWTAYWFEDWTHSVGYRGATSVLISSASAKTAFCAAYLVRKRRARAEADPGLKIVGLTSKRNVAFTRGLGLYDEVVDYDALESTLKGEKTKWLYVDVAGSDALNSRLFTHFKDGELIAAVALGMTSLSPASQKAATLSWQTNTFTEEDSSLQKTSENQLETFFMVEWLNVRKHQLSMQEIFRRQQQAWMELMKDCVPWVRLVRVSGAEAVKKAYDEVEKKGFSPDVGYIWSLWDEGGPSAKL